MYKMKQFAIVLLQLIYFVYKRFLCEYVIMLEKKYRSALICRWMLQGSSSAEESL